LKSVFSLIAAITLAPVFYFLPFGGDLYLKLSILGSALLLALAGGLVRPFTWVTGLELLVLAMCLTYFNAKFYLKRAKVHADQVALAEDNYLLENVETKPTDMVDGINETIGFYDLQAAAFDEGHCEQSFVLDEPDSDIEELKVKDGIEEKTSLDPSRKEAVSLDPSHLVETIQIPSMEEQSKEDALDFLVDEENWQQIRSQWNPIEYEEQVPEVLSVVAAEQREWVLNELILEEDPNDLELQENWIESVVTPLAGQAEETPNIEERQGGAASELFFNLVSEQLDWVKKHASLDHYEQAIRDYITTDLPDREYYMLSCKLRDLYLETAQLSKLKSLLQELKNRFYQVEYVMLEIDYYWKQTSTKDL
jgi:hypothetical protein